mgnify:CR=1 FL=1
MLLRCQCEHENLGTSRFQGDFCEHTNVSSQFGGAQKLSLQDEPLTASGMFDLLYFHWTHPFLMHLQGMTCFQFLLHFLAIL